MSISGNRVISVRTRRKVVASLVLTLFAIQTYIAILAAIPPEPAPPTPRPASPPTEFAFLNHTQISEDEDGYWIIGANSSIYIIAELGGPDVPWGGDQATFFFGEAERPAWDQTQYTCDTGLHSWARTLDDEWKLYNLSIPLWCRSRFTSLSVQPVYIAQGAVNATRQVPERVWFNASGDICILTWSLSNFTDLALQLDGMVLKRNDYADKMDYLCVLVADVVFQSEWLKFSARVPTGAHFLDIWGSENETTYYAICHGTADFDRDLLLDYEELMEGDAGLSPRWANPWGYRSYDEPYEAIPLERVIEENEVQGFWVRESTYFHVPDAYDGIPQSLMILDVNGRYTNLTIDADATKLRDKTLYAYHGEGENMVELIPPSGRPEQYWADEVMAPDWAFVENMQSGWHSLSYLVYKSPLETPQLGLFLNDQQVAIIGAMTNYPSDRDGDNVPDASELSPAASITWRKDSLLQLPVPCDRTTAEDVQVKFQVVRGENDPDPEKLLEWHAAENAGRQVRLTQVMIIYGPGSNAPARGQVDYWNNLDELCHFLGNATHPWPVDTYNLVGKDANGFANNSALTGDCDPLPRSGTAAYDYQMILFPSLAEKVAEYTLWYPSDHPAIQNDGTIVMRARWAIAVVDQSRIDPTDYSLLGLYDYFSNITISGAQVSFLSDVNGLLGEPRDSATHLACLFNNMNPRMAMDWDPEIERAIVANFTGAHFLTQYYFDNLDNTTLSAVERINYARNQTPWDGQSAEVTYITQTTRTLDLLGKINQSIQFDLVTGEQYTRYPKMYDFAPLGSGRYLNPGDPLIPGWTCTSGLGQASVRRNVQTRAGVLEMRPDYGDLTLHADRGVSNSSGEVTLAMYLDSAASTVEARIGTGETPDSFALVTENGYLKYRTAAGTTQPIYEIWPGEWFDLTIQFDGTKGTFDLYIDGAMQYSATNLTAWHPWTEIQTMDIIVSEGAVALDGISLYWGLLDPSYWEPAQCFESVHYGDVTERSSCFVVSDVYNGSFAPGDPELAGDEITLFQTYYSGFVHAMERANILTWPTKLRLVRASDFPCDAFSVDNFLNVSFVQGTYIPASWLPGRDATPYSWAGRSVPDVMIFRNLLLNEWADPNLNEFPATIALNIGDDVRWEWDWRVGEIDPWGEFHVRHTPPEGKAAVDHSLNNAINVIEEAVRFVTDLIERIDKGDIPDFHLITYYPVLGGHLLLDKPSLEQVNVGGSGVIPSSKNPNEQLFWFKEETTRDTLRASCVEFQVENANARKVIFCPKDGQADLFRYVRIIPEKLKELCPELWDLYVQRGNSLPRDLIQGLPYDEKDPSKSAIEVLGAGANKEEQVGLRWQYVRWVRKTITPRDKLNTAIGIGAAIDSDRPRFINLAQKNSRETYNKMREKNLGLDVRKVGLGLGKPGVDRVMIKGVWVQLPEIFPHEKNKPYIIKTLRTIHDPSGQRVQINVIYFNKGPLKSDQCYYTQPFTHFDPQSLPNTIAFNSELQGSKLKHTFMDDVYKKIRAAADKTGDPRLKPLHGGALKILQCMGHGSIKPLQFRSARKLYFDPRPEGNIENNLYKDNVFSDIFQELKKDPYPAEIGVPQVPPEKIVFLLEGEFRELNPAPWSRLKKRGMQTFEWEGRVTFRVPGPETPLSGDWARLIEKIASPYNIPEATQNRMREAAEKSRQDWREIFARADHILANFLRFLARTKADERMRQDPDIYLKVIAMAKNVINILEKMFPRESKGGMQDQWLDAIWVKIFGVHGPRGLSLATLIKAILADGLNVRPLDVDAALQIEGIRPTPFTQEDFHEFCQSGEFDEEEIRDPLQKSDIAAKTGALASNEAAKPTESAPELNSKKSSPTTEARARPTARDRFEEYCDLLRTLYPRRLPPWLKEELEEEERARAIAYSAPIPGLLGPRGYFARVGAALTFDIFFTSTLPQLTQSLVFVSQAVPLASLAGMTPITVAAAAGASPAYQAFYAEVTAKLSSSTARNALAQSGGYYAAVGGGAQQMAIPVLGGGGGDPTKYPHVKYNLEHAYREARRGAEEMGDNLDDAIANPASAASNRLAQVCAVLAVVGYALSAYNLIRDFQMGASPVQLGFDIVALGVALVQMSVAIAMVTLVSTSAAVTALTSAFLGTLSTGAYYVAVVEGIILAFVWFWSLWEQDIAEKYNTLDIDVSMRLVLPTSSNASLVRNGSLHRLDYIGIEYSVTNPGYMEWESTFLAENGVYRNIPKLSMGSPFWFHSKARVGSPDAMQETWTDWAGPWAGAPIDFSKDIPYFGGGDIMWPQMCWSTRGVAPWDGIKAASDPEIYYNYALINHTTTNLACQVQTNFATIYNGRTDAPNPVIGDIVVIGDTNGDGRIDPLYEEGLPVLEDTLVEFLASCSDVTPEVTLDSIIANFTSATSNYQWLDAANYLTSLLAGANAAAVFLEDRFNATVARFNNLTGDHAWQIWWNPTNSSWVNETLPASITDNYYLLQTSNITEWVNLLGGEQGQLLLDAGWRAARPTYDVIYREDFSSVDLDVTNFPSDWQRNPSIGGGTDINSLVKVQWRDPDAHDELVLRIKDTGDLGSYLSASKDFGPLVRGRLIVSLEVTNVQYGRPFYFGLAAPIPSGSGSSYKPWTDVAMLSMDESPSGGYWIFLGDPNTGPRQDMPIYDHEIYPGFEYIIFIDFDIMAGTATFQFGAGTRISVPLQAGMIPSQFITNTEPWAGGGQEYLIHAIYLQNLDDQGAHLNSFSHTTPQGQILVPKRWVAEAEGAFKILDQYAPLLAQLPCRTNINGSLSWGTSVPVLEANSTFTGAIDFIYQGTDNPTISYELLPPAGWDIEYDSRTIPLKNLLRVPFALDVPLGTPAGTYYLDFVERRADGSTLADNVTFACRIPIRVRYNATWDLNVIGLSDILAPGSSDTWAILFNGGTAPQTVYITGDGVPLVWLAADGYTPVARWDFNGGTGGWASAGAGTASFLDDQYSVIHNFHAVDSATPDWPWGSSFMVADGPFEFFPGHHIVHTYFTVPEVPAACAEPCVFVMRAEFYELSGTPGTMLAVAPAYGPVPQTWNEAPGFDAAARVWQAEVGSLPIDQPVSIGPLEAGVTYALFIDDGEGSAMLDLSFAPRAQYLYDKVTATSECLVLQSDTSEVVAAVKNMSALVQPGDRVRITYENVGASGAALGAWESYALTGSGWQERTFIAEGFYTLTHLTVSAQVGPGATFRVDSLSVERGLSRHVPLSELVFAGDTATPEMYGWAAAFGSGVTTMSFDAPVTNAGYVSSYWPDATYNTRELWVGNDPYGDLYKWTSFLQVPAPPATMNSYSTFSAASHPLLVAKYNATMGITAYPCDAFHENNLTYANHPFVYQDLGVNGSAMGEGEYEAFWAWDVTDFPTGYVCLNATQSGWYIFPSDEVQEIISPRVIYSIPKWGVAGGTLVVQSDQGETFRVSRALNNTGPELAVQAGDKVWASFETTTAGGATLVLVNADPLGANLTFPLATAADQNRGTIYREFVIPAGGEYTTIMIEGTLGAGQNFSLGFAGVYHYQPFGTPLASANIGGFYTETILPSQFTQYAPLAGGCFTFDGTADGFTGTNVATLGGSLTLAPAAASTVIASCALAGLVIPANTRARVRYNSTSSANSYVKFMTDAGEKTWVLPVNIPDSWQEITCLIPQECTLINGIVVGGDFTAFTNLSLDYLLLEAPAEAICVLPEVAGRRDVVALKNVAACGGAVNYSFPVPQTRGRLDFSIYAPGTNTTLAITLEGAGGAGINLMIADWQLWLGNLSGAFAAAGIYGGFHSISIAWDCATHNYTVWYYNQTLLEANYTTGWGVLNFTGSTITGIRIGTADARSAFYLDGVYFDQFPVQPSNLTLVETFRPGAGIYVNLDPGEEWALQLAAPPRSPLTAPSSYLVHLAIYDASTGQLIGLVHKEITIPAFYDIGLTCTTPVQIQQAASQTAIDGAFTFAGTLTNLGNVEQTLALATTGLDPRAAGTFYVDVGGTWEIGDSITLAPGEAQDWKLEILDAPAIACTFAVIAQSAHNITSIPITFVYNAAPDIDGGHIQGPFVVEWQPAGKDLLFTAWDNTTQDAWYEVYWETTYLGQGPWASGEAINIPLDPLFAAGASILGVEQDVRLFLRDGYSHPYTPSNIYTITIIVDDILPAVIAPPVVVTTWEDPLEDLTWTLIDNGAWDPATGWQDDFGDGTLGPQWLPADVIEHNGTLRLPPPAQDWMGTQLLAPAPAVGDFVVVTRIAHTPYPSGSMGGPGIVIPTDDDIHYIKWQAQPANAERTAWILVETRLGYIPDGTMVYGPVSGHLTTLAAVVHGTGPAATYDLWYCMEDTTWTRVVTGHAAYSAGAPSQRRFGLCTGPYDMDAEFDWVRCQTLRAAPGATYTISKNGVPLSSGGWAGFGTVTVSLDDLRPRGPEMIGDNAFTLVLNDPVGGTTSSTVHVDITQVAPVLNQPPDYSGVEGDTPTITWSIVDNYATIAPAYAIYLGLLGSTGIQIDAGPWVSGGTIACTLPVLTPGIFDCRLAATNDLGGISEDHVILAIVQSALVPAPAVTSSELPAGEDQKMVWEMPYLTLDVALTTTTEVTLVAGAWESNPVIDVPPALAEEGVYFSLAASDESSIQFPLTMNVSFNYHHMIYQWSKEDFFRGVGVYVYNEGTGAWELADCSVLGVRLYLTSEGTFVVVTLSVPHLSIFAVGLLNLPPTLSAPDDIAYLGGSTGHMIAWQVTDDSTSNPIYTITRDGTEVTSGAWSLDNLFAINVDGLAPGAYNYTLWVDDGRHGFASDSVMVVVDNFAPAVSAPADIIYSWGTTGNTIMWHLTDDTIQDPTYTLTQDGQVVASGTWPISNIITLDVDDLAVGNYQYHLSIADGLTGTASDEVRVTVLNTLPALSAPLDASYEYGSIPPTLAWTVADGTVLAGTYTVTLLGFPVAQGAWVSGDFISWMPAELLPGTWAATLTVEDGYGGVISDSLNLTVTNTPPVITGPHSAVFEAGNASAGAWVTVTDPSTASDAAYSIYRNGTRVASGRWTSGNGIYVDLRYTPPGRSNLEIIAWDGLGGMATLSLLATTTNLAPVVIAPAPVTFEVGTAAPVLNWTITDESAENATYALAANGVTFANSTWVSGDVVSLAVGSWMPGSYNVTLAAADGWGGVTENGTFVDVTNSAPVVSTPPTIGYEAGDPRPVASFLVTDISTRDPTYAAYLNGSLVASGTWAPGIPITVPAINLVAGSYFLTLSAGDGYGAESTGEVTITVWPDDDTTCDLANLTCTATPSRVTFTCDLVDPSGYASLDWVTLNGTTIPLANLSLVLNGTRATVSFNNTFAASGTYVLQLQLTDGDHDWPGDGTAGVFTCTFSIQLEDAVEILLGTILRQLDTLIATACDIDERVWRNLIIHTATRARNDVAAALAFYRAGRASKALTRARVARVLACVADVLVEVGQKVTHSNDTVWGELQAQAGAINANLASAIQIMDAARPHCHMCLGRCGRNP